MTIHAKLNTELDDHGLHINGWYDGAGYNSSNRPRIGNNFAQALCRLQIVGEAIEEVEAIYANDLKIKQTGHIKSGSYCFKGVDVRVRCPDDAIAYFFFAEASVKVFRELAAMMDLSDFSTDWLEHVEQRPVSE